jgi:ABC-type Mn2+/Zn2+ transport system ATPase subunit
MTASEPAMKVEDMTVACRGKPVLWDTDLEVPPNVLMAIVGPEERARRRSSSPTWGSSGHQQRVFLARALIQDATICFMDELFHGVDECGIRHTCQGVS